MTGHHSAKIDGKGGKTMSVDWYLMRAGQQHGPYTWEQIWELSRDGRLLPDDMIWSSALVGWTKALEVSGLAFPGIRTQEQSPAEHHPGGHPGGHQGAPRGPRQDPQGALHPHAAPARRRRPPSSSGNKGLLFALLGGLLLSVATVGALAIIIPSEDDEGSPGTARDERARAGDQRDRDAWTAKAGTEAGSGEEPVDTLGEGRILRPWIHSFVAEKSEIEVGASTPLRLDVRDPRGDMDFRIDWASSCGAAAPASGDGTRAVFFAPPRPGWCRVSATLIDSSRRRAESAVDILVTPAMSGNLLEAP